MSGIWFYENWHKSAAVLAKKTELSKVMAIWLVQYGQCNVVSVMWLVQCG